MHGVLVVMSAPFTSPSSPESGGGGRKVSLYVTVVHICDN